MAVLLQFAQALLMLTLCMVAYVLAQPQKERFLPAAVWWSVVIPLSVVSGAEMVKLAAICARLPFEYPVLSWAQEPFRALSIIVGFGSVGFVSTLGLLAFVRACLRGEKRPGAPRMFKTSEPRSSSARQLPPTRPSPPKLR